MRVFLVGFMGAGKSTVGRLLAARRATSFIDLDARVAERAGRSVPEIFARDGEPRFRRLEHRALREILDLEDVVVATGGGAMGEPANRRLMKSAGVTVWLDPPFAVLSARLRRAEASDRPLFRDEGQARELWVRRRPAYEQADLRIDVAAGERPDRVVSRIQDLLSRTR